MLLLIYFVHRLLILLWGRDRPRSLQEDQKRDGGETPIHIPGFCNIFVTFSGGGPKYVLYRWRFFCIFAGVLFVHNEHICFKKDPQPT